MPEQPQTKETRTMGILANILRDLAKKHFAEWWAERRKSNIVHVAKRGEATYVTVTNGSIAFRACVESRDNAPEMDTYLDPGVVMSATCDQSGEIDISQVSLPDGMHDIGETDKKVFAPEPEGREHQNAPHEPLTRIRMDPAKIVAAAQWAIENNARFVDVVVPKDPCGPVIFAFEGWFDGMDFAALVVPARVDEGAPAYNWPVIPPKAPVDE